MCLTEQAALKHLLLRLKRDQCTNVHVGSSLSKQELFSQWPGCRLILGSSPCCSQYSREMPQCGTSSAKAEESARLASVYALPGPPPPRLPGWRHKCRLLATNGLVQPRALFRDSLAAHCGSSDQPFETLDGLRGMRSLSWTTES